MWLKERAGASVAARCFSCCLAPMQSLLLAAVPTLHRVLWHSTSCQACSCRCHLAVLAVCLLCCLLPTLAQRGTQTAMTTVADAAEHLYAIPFLLLQAALLAAQHVYACCALCIVCCTGSWEEREP